MSLASSITGWLFQTGAVRVSPADRPFWYTSGLIGPYYVNTHFLYGSEQQANQLLALIDRTKTDPLSCTEQVRASLWENYERDPVFRQVTNALVEYIKTHYAWEQMDCLSGGERRDWFFSVLPAELLGKPHLTIFKDKQMVSRDQTGVRFVSDLTGQKILHVSDLITEASSYLRAWIPAVTERGGKMVETLTIVDRKQGGAEALRQQTVGMQSLVQIDAELFHEAAAQGHLSSAQHQLVADYLADQHGSMRAFLLGHPEFLRQALAADEKTRQRALLLLNQDLYQLGAYGGSLLQP